MMEAMSSLAVWIFFLVKPGWGHETIQPMKLVGFCIMVIGFLIFAGLICRGQHEMVMDESIDARRKSIQD